MGDALDVLSDLSAHKVILPGATIGVLGSGQLGRMFTIAARQMGYRVHTLSPDSDTPTGQVADAEVIAAYEDLDAVRAFARDVSVVTFEFENVPAETAQAAAEVCGVRPAGEVLHTTQHRLREKTFLSNHGFPVAPYAVVRSAADLDVALRTLGVPAILKTAGWGYDGKGQVRINTLADAANSWASLNTHEAALEAFVDFACELSVVAARSHDGAFCHWGVVENQHVNHILDLSISPARIAPEVATLAIDIARGVLTALNVVGVLCVEFFLTRSGQLLINELAPRPHNSGHFTIDASRTSQFAQQVRAVCGMPLGDTSLHSPSAMVNLMGDQWFEPDDESREPDWAAAVALPGVTLHLYGKHEPRHGRKMGHLTALAPTTQEAAALAIRARHLL